MRRFLLKFRAMIVVIPVVLALTALASACGGSDSKPADTKPASSGASSAPAAASPAPAAPSVPQVFELHATDQGSGFIYQPVALQAKPGEITIKFTNDSIRSHSFVIKSKDGTTELAHSADLDKGGSAEVKFTIKDEGSYQFFCDHTGHSDRGLKSTLTVAKAAT